MFNIRIVFENRNQYQIIEYLKFLGYPDTTIVINNDDKNISSICYTSYLDDYLVISMMIHNISYEVYNKSHDILNDAKRTNLIMSYNI